MVLITFRTLQGKLYKIELDEAMTVGEAKTVINQEIAGSSPNMKLIFKGSVLADATKIGSIKIGPNDFVIVHFAAAKKPAPAPATPAPAPATPAPAPATPAPAPAPAPATPATPAPAPAPATPASQPTTAPLPEIVRSPPPAAPQVGAGAGMGRQSAPRIEDSPEFAAGVQTLMDMGFGRTDCEAALKAAFGNTDRAAEYLLTGNIPDNGDDEDGEMEEAVRRQGEFIRALMAQSPEALENIIRTIEMQDPVNGPQLRAHPEMLLIQSGVDPIPHADLITRIRNRTAQPVNPSAMDFVQPSPASAPAAPAPSPSPAAAPAEGGPAGIMAQFSAEERAAIERIQQIGGWPLGQVIQVYVACDKNEELTANMLFDMN